MDLAKELLIFLEGYHMYNQAINNYCAEIAKLPATQSTKKIVFCKDCRHNGQFDTDCPITWPKDEGDFCSYAEE